MLSELLCTTSEARIECSAISISAASLSASGRADTGEPSRTQRTRHEMGAVVFIGSPETLGKTRRLTHLSPPRLLGGESRTCANPSFDPAYFPGRVSETRTPHRHPEGGSFRAPETRKGTIPRHSRACQWLREVAKPPPFHGLGQRGLTVPHIKYGNVLASQASRISLCDGSVTPCGCF